LHRDAVSRAIHSEAPPAYRRAPSGSKLDPFKDEIHRLLRVDPKFPGQRIREDRAAGLCGRQDDRRSGR